MEGFVEGVVKSSAYVQTVEVQKKMSREFFHRQTKLVPVEKFFTPK